MRCATRSRAATAAAVDIFPNNGGGGGGKPDEGGGEYWSENLHGGGCCMQCVGRVVVYLQDASLRCPLSGRRPRQTTNAKVSLRMREACSRGWRPDVG